MTGPDTRASSSTPQNDQCRPPDAEPNEPRATAEPAAAIADPDASGREFAACHDGRHEHPRTGEAARRRSSPARTLAAAAGPQPVVAPGIGGIAESATLAVDAKAKALKAAGRPVIGFGAGEPDFPTPDYIVAGRRRGVLGARPTTATPPPPGLPALREAVAEKTLRDSGYEVAPEQVLITNGGKQAVYQAFATLLDPGDEVLLPAPYWTTYPEAIALAGGVSGAGRRRRDAGYLVTRRPARGGADAADQGAAVLLAVEPDRRGLPAGRRSRPSAGGRRSTGIWVITDEIYEHLVYGDAQHVSMPVVAPEIADRCIVVNGVAKTYAMTGWRVGWMIGPKDVVKAATNLQSHLTSNVCNVAQQAALTAVAGSLDAVAEMRAAFDRRRRTIVELLDAIPGVSCPEPRGRVLRVPVGDRELIGKDFDGVRPASSGGAGDAGAGPGRGRGRARRGVRHARLLPAVLRARRRRPGDRRDPDGRVPRDRPGLSPRRRSCTRHLHAAEGSGV